MTPSRLRNGFQASPVNVLGLLCKAAAERLRDIEPPYPQRNREAPCHTVLDCKALFSRLFATQSFYFRVEVVGIRPPRFFRLVWIARPRSVDWIGQHHHTKRVFVAVWSCTSTATPDRGGLSLARHLFIFKSYREQPRIHPTWFGTVRLRWHLTEICQRDSKKKPRQVGLSHPEII
jgi:hypothetical protein